MKTSLFIYIALHLLTIHFSALAMEPSLSLTAIPKYDQPAIAHCTRNSSANTQFYSSPNPYAHPWPSRALSPQKTLYKAVAEKDNMHAVKYALDHGATIDEAVFNNALKCGYARIKFLIQHYLEAKSLDQASDRISLCVPFITNDTIQKAIKCAALDVEAVEYILLHAPVRARLSSAPRELLQLALQNNRLDLAKWFAIRDGNVYQLRWGLGSFDVLHAALDTYAFSPVHEHFLNWLLEQDVDINAQIQDTSGFNTKAGFTPLHRALYYYNYEAVVWLVQNGARLDIPNAAGLDAINYARWLLDNSNPITRSWYQAVYEYLLQNQPESAHIHPNHEPSDTLDEGFVIVPSDQQADSEQHANPTLSNPWYHSLISWPLVAGYLWHKHHTP